MLFIKSPHNLDPKINLAIEEYAVRNFDIEKDYLFIYQNKPSVIIGKNQNPFEEINLSYIFNNKIEICRRISGGGAVYHEPGNVNFCYITKSSRENFNKYKIFLNPIVNYLNRLGLKAFVNSRNDLVIDNRKVSGNAQFTSRGRMLCHGTLLFSANLSIIRKTLMPLTILITSKSTKSVRSEVTNISEYLPETLSLTDFIAGFQTAILEHNNFDGEIILNPEQWMDVNKLAEEKYDSWEWTWGRTPAFTVNVTLSPFGNSNMLLHIENGIIKSIEADNSSALKQLINRLTGIRYQRETITLALLKIIAKERQKLIADCLFPF